MKLTSETEPMNEIDRTNPMRKQIIATAPALKAMYWDLETRARLLLTTPEIFSVRRIILCGCGDSRMAGQSAEMAFEKYAGIPTETQRAMDASRYAAQVPLGDSSTNPLVILISSSGDVARVVEAAQQYSRNGARTVAITSRPQSGLAKSTRPIFPFSAPSLPPAPGFFSYAASLTMLYLLAIRIGEVKGGLTQSQAQEKRYELAQHIGSLADTIKSVDGAVRSLALSWQGLNGFEFLGSGPGYGVASSVACSRASEIVWLVKKRESPCTVVSGGDPAAFDCDGQRFFHIPESIPEEFSPLLCSAPLALFASYLADITGASYGRGHAGRWEDSKGGNAVCNSELLPVRA